jgi:hypothetical protein
MSCDGAEIIMNIARERKRVGVAQSSKASGKKADNVASRINFALPGLTRCRTFDVMSFANCSRFCIGKDRDLE